MAPESRVPESRVPESRVPESRVDDYHLDASVLKVADLVGRPGASRKVDLRLGAPSELDLPLVIVSEPLRLTGVLESVVDGVLVRGTLAATLQMQCSRCLVDVLTEVDTEVVELFTRVEDIEPGDDIDEGYEIREGRLDLDTLLRDALVPAVPYRPLCDAACEGICEVCGTNRNEGECGCVDTPRDVRWTALEGLRFTQED